MGPTDVTLVVSWSTRELGAVGDEEGKKKNRSCFLEVSSSGSGQGMSVKIKCEKTEKSMCLVWFESGSA